MVAATMPVYVVGNAASNWRLVALVGLTIVAGCRPASPFPVRPGAAAALAGALLVVGGLRTAGVGAVWWLARADLVAVQAVLARVSPGAAVLPVEQAPDLVRAAAVAPHRVFVGGTPLYWHLATLAVPWRDAFLPTLFTGRGKQPVRPRPPWDALAVPHGPPPSIHALALPGEVLRARLAADPKLYLWRYLAHWREDFGYVLVLNVDQPDQEGPVPPIAGLELVANEGFAQLWRIQPVPPPVGGQRPGRDRQTAEPLPRALARGNVSRILFSRESSPDRMIQSDRGLA
ncbi:hypothetical protein [Roseomonas fluvialis]|uniref:hypothetical protein n=1 Tax=Roseomonas fluvialis TaxID=1750527 RepID=UPI001FCBCA64|nr:hypothetical protein [Roseomonas fluvialis]